MQKNKSKKSSTILSVALATYNEEQNIVECLNSVRTLADEIVIVDGSSTDETVELARKAGARVIITDNKPIFHINKQLAMDNVAGKLILQLDADEIVDDELHAFLLKLKETFINGEYDVKTQPVAWWIKRNNFFLGTFMRKGGQYPDAVIRLYVNGYASLPQKDVHEQMDVNGKTGFAEGHLIHYSNKTFGDYLRKWNAYTSLSAEALAKEHSNPNFLLFINYLFLKPIYTFFLLYFRHKGLLDGFPGFVFALMSGIFHQMVYLKYWELRQTRSR